MMTTKPEQIPADAIKASSKRYLILYMYFVLASVKAFQWICFPSITNIVASHYQVGDIAINWTAVVFMITFICLCLPIGCLMEIIGLRKSILIGTFGTNLGVIMKCFACHRSGFALAMVGHIIVGCVEPFFFSIYSKLAQVWFPDNQVAMATAICVCGETLGNAIGFILPSLMVGNDPDDHVTIEDGLFRMFVGIATITTLNTVLIILFFDEQPDKAPGYARYKQIELEAARSTGPISLQKRNYLNDLKSFILDGNFNTISVAFGINVGTGYAVHTLLNQILAGENSSLGYENPVLVTGIAGAVLMVVGIFGSIFCGHLLDTFHAYKLTSVLVYLFTFLSMVALAFCINLSSEFILYSMSAGLGFFFGAYMCCGFDVAVEITYPRSELMSSTILNMSAQVFGIMITFMGSHVVDTYGGRWGCWFLCAALAVGLLVNCILVPDYRRQRVIGGQHKLNELSHITVHQNPSYYGGAKTC